MLIQQPQILLQRLQAALQLPSQAIIDEISASIPDYDIEPMYKVAAIKLLAIYHCPDQAAKSLIAASSLHDKPRFLNLTKLIFKELQDKTLKQELTLLVAKASGGGTLIKPVPSEYNFLPQPENETWGSVELALAPTTPRHHMDGLTALAENFRTRASKGRQPNVFEYKNVFTDASGQIWTDKGEIIMSHSIPIPTVSRSEVQNFSVAFAANRGNQGLYHWLIDYLPGFSWLRNHEIMDDEDFHILLNGNRPKFEKDILDILQLGLRAHKMSQPVFVERLLVARVGFRGMVGWSHLDNIFGTLGERSSALAEQNNISLPEKIYITRRGADRRVLLNEVQVENEARERGFEIRDFATIPIWHQIAIARNAKTIMSPHGAGLSHIVFSSPGTKIIELLPIKDGTYPLRFNYARISIMKGHRYHAWVEEQRPTLNEWTIDLPHFTDFLDRTLKR
ncbi:hypothetical protein ASF08_22325 [Methylobacterium sp. Leaf85]|nr:hypothetical protein ASF08_22325 [Methylobacterium sp. Leaf85]